MRRSICTHTRRPLTRPARPPLQASISIPRFYFHLGHCPNPSPNQFFKSNHCQRPVQLRAAHTNMSSDDAYASFLDKANQPTSSSEPSTQSTKGFPHTQTMSKDEQAPQSLGELNINYTSDTDEPFEPVALKWKRGDLNAGKARQSLLPWSSGTVTLTQHAPKTRSRRL